MKKYQSKIFALIFPIVLSGCLNEDFKPEEWALEPELDFSKSTVLFNSTNSVDTIQIYTNYNDFSAVSNSDWCNVSIDKSNCSIAIAADPNINEYQRSSEITITISRGNRILSKNISIVQMGGIWESIGDFNVYWGYNVSESQKEAVKELLQSMIYVDSGDFVMGDTDELIVDSTHPHSVSLTSFYIGKYEITQKQWRAIMGNNPSYAKGDNVPIYNISWAEALEFCTRLSTLTHLNINLPTEAQWEYASKGGNKSKGYKYSGNDDYTKVAYFNNSDYALEPTYVGSLQCNELGIYDMSGNVAEYCSDWFELDYEDQNKTNPTGPSSGTFKCVRGGHLNNSHTYYLRNTHRFFWSEPINKVTSYTGFRITATEQ